jgi:hypothetical protein
MARVYSYYFLKISCSSTKIAGLSTYYAEHKQGIGIVGSISQYPQIDLGCRLQIP